MHLRSSRRDRAVEKDRGLRVCSRPWPWQALHGSGLRSKKTDKHIDDAEAMRRSRPTERVKRPLGDQITMTSHFLTSINITMTRVASTPLMTALQLKGFDRIDGCEIQSYSETNGERQLRVASGRLQPRA